MRKDKSKLFAGIFTVAFFGFILAAGAITTQAVSSAFHISPPFVSANTSSETEIVNSASSKILNGDFEAAEKLISRIDNPSSRQAKQLAKVIEEYNELARQRQQEKQGFYEKYLEELNEIRKKGTPTEVNDIDEAFLKVVQVKNYANEQQEKELLTSPFVENLIDTALDKALQYEQDGQWLDAYAHCFYWINNLFPDNEEAKNQGERLTQLAMIEMTLKDNTCETSAERHAGITPKMLMRSIRALDFSYVSLLDYKEMAKKGVERCILLGQVLYADKEDVAYKVEDSDIDRWQMGLNEINNKINARVEGLKNDDLTNIYAEVLALNTLTLQIPQEVVVAQFSEGALEALDPFTNIIWPWKVQDFQKSMTQDFTGIGVHITKNRSGVLSVASLLPDTPAYKSGLDANDEILAVNGEPTKDMTLNCVVSKITGPQGTKVTLTIRHEGDPKDKTEDITIVRDRIQVPTIRGWIRGSDDKTEINTNGSLEKAGHGDWGHMIDSDNKIGYIRLTGFTENTAPAMKQQLKNLEKRGMKGLIIDLRDNSGGYLSTAAAIVDMFVEEGLIVKSQPRWGIANYERASKKGTHPNYPIVILINGNSASASEIVAGALQDEKYKRATLVGTRTYGKGSVQTIVPYSGDGSQLKYTMAYYHLPSDQRVKNRYIKEKQGRDDWGIAPDVEVELTNEEMKKRIEAQWSNDMLSSTGLDKDGKPVKRYTAQETLDADPQMQVAIMVLKTKLIEQGETVEFPEKIKTAKKIDTQNIPDNKSGTDDTKIKDKD